MMHCTADFCTLHHLKIYTYEYIIYYIKIYIFLL